MSKDKETTPGKARTRSKKIAAPAKDIVGKKKPVLRTTPNKKELVVSTANESVETIVIDEDSSEEAAKKTSFFETKATNEAPDFLSPVSKLHRAKEIAAKEQQERINAAEAKRAEESRQRKAKRKELASETETNLHNKIAKTVVNESEAEINSPAQPIAAATGAVHLKINAQQNGEKKSKIKQNAGESATAYALRAANLVKEERKKQAALKAQAPPQATEQMPVATEEKVATEQTAESNTKEVTPEKSSASPDSVYDTPEFVARTIPGEKVRSASSFPDVMHVVHEATEATKERFLTRSTPKNEMSTLRLCIYTAVLLLTVVAVLLSATSLYIQQLPMCDSNTNSTEPRINCRQCPVSGICSEGSLVDCEPNFVPINGACQEVEKIQRDSTLMAKMLETIWTSEATSVYCSESITDRLSLLDVQNFVQDLHLPPSTSLSTEALREHLREDPVWKSVGPKTFDLAFKKALGRLGFEEDATLISLTSENASIVCQATNFTLEYFTPVIVTLLILAMSIYSYFDGQQNAHDVELLDRTFTVVQEELIAHRDAHPEDSSYACHHLRDHVTDILNLSSNDKQRVNSTLWGRLREMVQADERIQEDIVKRGPNDATVVVWQWVGSAVEKDIPSSNTPLEDNATTASVQSA
ncbi:hypothetical protein THRCLA_05860 [Thraustotheca clavata]|uniref:Man1/Src1-like C-terminal domain-containing protein n=1 Tax=Thraustotheca clavata TaxID=74557 RepID=A0A1V9ZS13_9STRA|nr:hypothetical protein THRCLA_05860 [Thraustotheca clavata]